MSNKSTIDIRRHVTPSTASMAIALHVLLVVAPFASVAEAQVNGGLFAAVDGEHSADAADDVAETPGIRTMRSRLVRVDVKQLEAAREVNATLALNLFEEVLLSAVVERAAPTASGIGYALSGRINLATLSGQIADGDFGAMTLIVYGENDGTMVTGTVNASIGTFTIRPIGNGVHAIRRIDTSALPPPGEPLTPPPPTGDPGTVSRQPPPPGAEGADEFSEIDVAVFYTPAARDGAATLKGNLESTGITGIDALVDEMFANANAAYQRSGAIQRVRCVLRQEVAYTESGNPGTDLDKLTDKSDGVMDGVHDLRDEHGADLVHLISGAGDFCGLAWIGPRESYGFSLAAYNCEVGYLTFAHELGHNMGLNHDRYAVKCEEQASGRPDTCSNYIDNHPYAHSYGYVNQRAFSSTATRNQAWRTIMAYDLQCRDAGFPLLETGWYCQRKDYFSNPSLNQSGDALGVSGTADSQEVTGPSDAVRTLNLTRTTVASFR